MQLCQFFFLPVSYLQDHRQRNDGHRRNEDHCCSKSSLFRYDYRSLSLCQSKSISQGTISPLGWAVVWMVSAIFLFLRTNRVIIPSRGEDEAIKHARKGGDFLMCFVVSDAITVPIMWCFIFQSPWILPSLSFSLICPHINMKKQQHVACVPKRK